VLTAYRQLQGDTLDVRLSGAIDEHADLEALFGAVPASVRVHLKGVNAINSEGLRTWIRFFQRLSVAGTRVILRECSVAVVEQINNVSNFLCGAKVESIYLPFYCPKCKTELLSLFKTKDLKEHGLAIPEMRCPRCQGRARFDEDQDTYFLFLTR
jgi:Zn finger protein HypA/HybF involved in hydrogenase expression